MTVLLVPIHEYNRCHSPAGSPVGGQFCSTGGAGRSPLGDETDGTTPPAVGETFTVFRLGRATGGLENKNAANAHGLAGFLARIADFEKPQPAGGTGDTITMYEVRVTEPFGRYDTMNQGRGTGLDWSGAVAQRPAPSTSPGREVLSSRHGGDARINYSFPKGGGWKVVTHGPTVTIAEFNAYLRTLGYQDADDSGSLFAAKALRDLFARKGSV